MAPVKAMYSSPYQTRESPRQVRDTPRTRRNDDSPSRRTEFDLDQAFRQMHLHHSEWQKVHAFQRKQQQQDLDAKESAQARIHRESLDSASAQHELVRQQAEAVLHAYLEKEEEERRRKEEERRRKEEEEQRQREEEERQRVAAEERRRQEAERARRQAEEERLAQEAQRRREQEEQEQREKQRQVDEQRRVEADAQARKQREATEQAEQAQQVQQAARAKAEQEAAMAASAKPAATVAAGSDFEAEHHEYRAIHRKLKGFRKELWTSSRKDPNLKPHIGDMRRAIRTVVGQLTGDKETDRVAQEKISHLLRRARTEVVSAPVSVNEFLPSWQSLHDDNSAQIPALVLYLLSIFSKAVVSAYANECSTNTKAAEPIGIMVAKVFSLPELQFNRNVAAESGEARTVSLISVLVSKFHVSAPVLFGVYGPETTKEGMLRLGWRLTDTDAGSSKVFVSANTHWDRMKGLGAGYASITLRNFSRAKNTKHPWPPTHYWRSMAHILNTPPSQVTTSHLTVLKSMVENNAVERFVLFFGAAAVAVLKQATMTFPRTLSKTLQDGQEGRTLTYLVETWKEKHHFTLE